MKAKKIAAVLLAGLVLGSVALSGCGKLNANATAVTIDDTKVSLGFANFAAKYQQAICDKYYVAYFGEDVWKQESNAQDGKTMQDVQKDNIMEQLEDWYLLDAAKDDYNVSISDEEQTGISEAAKAFMDANSKEAISQAGATQEYVEQLLYFNLLQYKMKNAIEEKAEVNVSDEDAAMRTFSYITFAKPSYSSTASNTSASSSSASSSSSSALTQEQINAYAQQAKTDFDTVGTTVGTQNTYSYDKNDSQMDKSVIEEADKLKAGEVSGLIEGDDNYYVIRLDSEYDAEASASNKETLIQEQKDNYYTDVLKKLRDNAKIKVNTSEWKKVTFTDLFEISSDEEQ